MNKAIRFTLLAAASIMAVSTLVPSSALADSGHRPGWGHGDIRYFPKYDAHVWYGGRWHHGGYHGRYGWWWVVAGVWYFYPAPVYPYPNPYVPPYVVMVNPAYTTTTVAPTAPPAVNVWYFCKSANAYYPYAVSCPEGWQKVPATPPPSSSAPPAPPVLPPTQVNPPA